VPAPAVIPALIMYTKVVAVKKLVVEFWGFHLAIISVLWGDVCLAISRLLVSGVTASGP